MQTKQRVHAGIIGPWLACCLSMCSPAAPNPEQPGKPGQFEYDAQQQVLGAELKPGLNPISKSRAGDLELNVKAVEGQPPEYVILSNGQPIESFRKEEKKGAKTTCWECGKDKAGDTHCWKIPCPVIVGPWTPGKKLELAPD